MQDDNNRPGKFADMMKRFFLAAWEYIKEAKMELLVLCAAVAADLISKSIVSSTMRIGQTVTLIPFFLNITYTLNDAAAFGSSFGLDALIGRTGTLIIFILITFAAIGFFGYFMYKNRGKNKVCRVALALIIGGAIGNLADRLAFGYVRDFVEFVYFGLTIFGSKSFAIFNIADAALCIGVAMFVVYYLFIYKEPKKKAAKKRPAPIAKPAADGDDDDLPSPVSDDDDLPKSDMAEQNASGATKTAASENGKDDDNAH